MSDRILITGGGGFVGGAVLERLVEASKPPVPRDVARLGLHWLLFTPFRYAPPPGGSGAVSYTHPHSLPSAPPDHIP